ncbi:MAG: hypothetical protein WD638_02875 [Nitriliruptoraceae bacterium]
MVEDAEEQATALDSYWTALDAGETPEVREPSLAGAVRLLRRRLAPEPPRDGFIADLRRALEERAAATPGRPIHRRRPQRYPCWAAVGLGTGSLVVLSLGVLLMRLRRHGTLHVPQL